MFCKLSVDAKSKNRSRRKEYKITENDAFHTTEAFRHLKASLSVSLPKRKNEGGVILMIASARPESGKTTVAANLALMFAMSNIKVLVIDADIRKGRLARYFGVTSKPGLTDYLSGQASMDEIIRGVEDNDHLSYITCGTRSLHPYELLESDEMKELLAQLKTKYDYILIDTPPILVVSDAMALVTQTDGVILVCRHKISYVNDIKKAVSELEFAKANLLGVVINDYKEKSRLSYKHQYKYGKYYDYAYENDDEE